MADVVLPDVDELRRVGTDQGLDVVGVTGAEPFDDARGSLESRRDQGLASSMQFTYRRPERSTDPSMTLPSAASLVVAARNYRRDDPEPPVGASARVARYARVDHYASLRTGLEAIAGSLHDAGWRAIVLADDNALVDRAAAQRAGIGAFGKNSNLLVGDRGSWFVLGSVLTDAPLPPDAPDQRDPCGSCRRCLDGCPTGAIIAPGVVDARRCLAWLVQAEGDIPREYRVALGDRIYGCDDCQEVCPPNRRQARRVPAPTEHGQTHLRVLDLLTASDEELLASHGRWYIPRRDPRYVRRNALVVLGNTAAGADPAVVRALEHFLADDDPMLRAHAAWAARRLGRRDLVDAAGLGSDPAPAVQAELAAPDPPERSV